MSKVKEKKPKKGFLDGYKTYDTKEGFGNLGEWRAAWKNRMDHQEATTTLGRDDPLKTMGFSDMPTKIELNTRYRELVKIHHPDVGGDPVEFKKVQAAWSLLMERIK